MILSPVPNQDNAASNTKRRQSRGLNILRAGLAHRRSICIPSCPAPENGVGVCPDFALDLDCRRLNGG